MSKTYKPLAVYTKDFFLKHFEKEFREDHDMNNDPEKPVDSKDKLEWVGNFFFGIDTYDSPMLELMTLEYLEVSRAITEKQTFEYIKGNAPEYYGVYLRVVNSHFFADKLDWGCSIRGAWWDYAGRFSCREVNGEFGWKSWVECNIALFEFLGLTLQIPMESKVKFKDLLESAGYFKTPANSLEIYKRDIVIPDGNSRYYRSRNEQLVIPK